MTQGEHLRNLIKADGRSINKIAIASGVSREHLSRVVNEKEDLGEEVAGKIAPVLGLSLGEVLLPKEVEVESRRGLERRLESLAADLAEAVKEQARMNSRIQRLQARVRTLEARPWPGEAPTMGQAEGL